MEIAHILLDAVPAIWVERMSLKKVPINFLHIKKNSISNLLQQTYVKQT